MGVELLAEHPCVDGRRLREERRAEACREGRLRLGDADLGAGELGREAGEEPVHRLVAAQPRDRRQDPERVGGEEHDRARVTSALRGERVRDLLELVRRARVLGLRVVVEIEDTALVHDDVLEHGPERTCRGVDLGLGLGREPDHLRVAAALEVEDAVVGPPVLVVADQASLRDRPRASSFRSREPEEHGDSTVVVDVRRAVHREDALQWEPVVHDGEDRLLDLACVERPADDDLGPRRVQEDERVRARPVLVRIGRDRGCMQDERLRLHLLELLLGRLDEQRLREERVPGLSLITRTAMRCAGSAPANASRT